MCFWLYLTFKSLIPANSRMSIGLILYLFVQDCNPCQSKWLSDKTGEFGPHTEDKRTEQVIWPLPPSQVLVLHLMFQGKIVQVVGAWTLPLELADDRSVLSPSLPSSGDAFLSFKHRYHSSEAFCICQAGVSWVLPSSRSFREEAAWEDGAQTVAPSLFSLLRKKKIFKYLHA